MPSPPHCVRPVKLANSLPGPLTRQPATAGGFSLDEQVLASLASYFSGPCAWASPTCGIRHGEAYGERSIEAITGASRGHPPLGLGPTASRRLTPVPHSLKAAHRRGRGTGRLRNKVSRSRKPSRHVSVSRSACGHLVAPEVKKSPIGAATPFLFRCYYRPVYARLLIRHRTTLEVVTRKCVMATYLAGPPLLTRISYQLSAGGSTLEGCYTFGRRHEMNCGSCRQKAGGATDRFRPVAVSRQCYVDTGYQRQDNN